MLRQNVPGQLCTKGNGYGEKERDARKENGECKTRQSSIEDYLWSSVRFAPFGFPVGFEI